MRHQVQFERPLRHNAISWCASVFLSSLTLAACDEKQGSPDEPEFELPIPGGGTDGISSGRIWGGNGTVKNAQPPADLIATEISDTGFRLSWTDRAEGEILNELESCAGEGCENFEPTISSPIRADVATSLERGLETGVIYRYRIRAAFRDGATEWAVTEPIRTLLSPIVSLAVQSASASAITLAMTTSRSVHTATEVERCKGEGCSDFRATFGSPFAPGLTSHTESGLQSGTAYRFRARVVSDGFVSAWATTPDIVTTVGVVAPSGIAIGDITDTAATISWTDNSPAELLHELQRCSGNGCTNFTSAPGSPLGANVTTYSASGLSADTWYTYRIRAVGYTGESAWLTAAAFQTAPPAPTSFALGTPSSSSIPLTWIDNSSSETGYAVERCAGSGCTIFAAVAGSPLAPNTQTFSAGGLTGGTTYRFRVRAERGGIGSSWITSGNLTTAVAAAACSAPKTVTIDRGLKSNSANTGRGLWSDLKLIPGTGQQAIAYYDGSATGGTASLRLAWWNGTSWQHESVAADSRVVAGSSATFVRLAFLNNGRPMVFWTNGGTQVRAAMRSAALTAVGTWSAGVIDTVAGAATRALEVSVSPLDQVGIVYLTKTLNTGRARFIFCDSGCSSLAGFTAMTTATDTIEATNIIAATVQTGIAWCRHNSTTFYPAVVYPGNAGANIRYASCNGALSTCRVAGGWTGRATNVVAGTAITAASLVIDSSIDGDNPAIVTRNGGATLMQVFRMNQACNAAPGYSFTAGATFGAATSGTAWMKMHRDTGGRWHVATNLGATNVHYHNSITDNLVTTGWNTAGVVDTVGLPAAGAGRGGADFNRTTNQYFMSYGNVGSPFNINMGIVADASQASSSAASVFSSVIPDASGNIALPLASGQVRNVRAASTSTGQLAVAYVDHSAGTVAAGVLKYAFRSGATAESPWTRVTIPNVLGPVAPSLAFDHNNLPWISYYDSIQFRYFLLTNSATDGSGDWNQFQFPINAKTASGAAPATDDTAMAMSWSAGVAKPVMIVLNSTANGGSGVRAGYFEPGSGTFSTVQVLDALGANFGTRLTADHDTAGNIVVAWHDITATRVEYNWTSNGVVWLGTPPQISAANVGREGLSIRLNPATSRPAVSYFDRTNNSVFVTRCNSAIALCSLAGNWSTATVATGLGLSTLPVANEQLLSTSLTFSADGATFVSYMTGHGATTQSFLVADNATGSYLPVTLRTRSAANLVGSSPLNFDIAGFHASSVRTSLGTLASVYIGPNNWLQATTCGD